MSKRVSDAAARGAEPKETEAEEETAPEGPQVAAGAEYETRDLTGAPDVTPDTVEPEELERQAEPPEERPPTLPPRGTRPRALFPAPAPPPSPRRVAGEERWRRLLLEERSRLEALRAEFDREGLRTRTEQEDLSELSAVDQHPADSGTETFDRERDLSIREQVEAELRDVERALERLDEGTYGMCEVCGKPIGADRLAAVPAARHCLADQIAGERGLPASGR